MCCYREMLKAILTSSCVQECTWYPSAGCAIALITLIFQNIRMMVFFTFLYTAAEQFDKSAYEIEVKN